MNKKQIDAIIKREVNKFLKKKKNRRGGILEGDAGEERYLEVAPKVLMKLGDAFLQARNIIYKSLSPDEIDQLEDDDDYLRLSEPMQDWRDIGQYAKGVENMIQKYLTF